MGSARRELVLHAALGVTAVVLSLVSTREGVGIDGDSAAYLGTAQNVLDGRGVTVPFTLYTDDYSPAAAAEVVPEVPLTHFPPLYPLALAALAAVGPDVDDAARVLGGVLLGVNVFFVARLARRLVPNAVVRLCVVLLAACGPVAGELLPSHADRTWLFQHGQAMSEGLFTTFVLLVLLGIDHYRDHRSPRSLLLVVGASSASVATRYAGVAVVATAALAVAALTPTRVRRRAMLAAAIAGIALTPIVVWNLVVSLFADGRAARTLHAPALHSPDVARVFEGWLGMGRWTPSARHVGLAVVIVIVAAALRRAGNAMFTVLAGLVVLSTAVILATRAFIDASTPADDRMFSPVQGPFYVLVIGAIGSSVAPRLAGRELAQPVLRAIGLGIPIGLVLSSLPEVDQVFDDGVALSAGPQATALAVDDLPARALIATNVPTQVWEATGRGSIRVPLRIEAATNERNRWFRAEVAELVRVIVRARGYLVLLNPDAGGFGTIRMANEADFAPYQSLRVVRRLGDGVVLGAR